MSDIENVEVKTAENVVESKSEKSDDKSSSQDYFHRDYVNELRRENKKVNDKAKEATATLESIKKEYEEKLGLLISEKTALSSKIETEVREKIQAKLETAAVSAGIKDLDLLKLIDKESIKLSEDGKVLGVSDAIASLKETKPFLFGEEKKVSSSTVTKSVDPTPVKFDVMGMSDAEYRIYKEKVLRGQVHVKYDNTDKKLAEAARIDQNPGRQELVK